MWSTCEDVLLGSTGGPQPVDRGELLARGMTNQQVDALEVQARIATELRLEVLDMDHIIRWVICFMCTLCVVGAASFGLLIWLIISPELGTACELDNIGEKHAESPNEQLTCDAPLLEWVTVVTVDPELLTPLQLQADTVPARKAAVCSSQFGEHQCCSICLEEWSSQKEIRKTACGHCYHTTCLKGWLNVNRNCPLCRTDLVTGQGAAVVGASEEP
eukprot:Skav206488  [mRNA]  locus=scaffold1128:97021:99319:+ [translate_table: standard]